MNNLVLIFCFSELGQDPNLMLLFPEKYYNPQLDISNVYWTTRTKSTSFPLSKDSGGKSLLKNVGWEASNTGKLEKANRYETGQLQWSWRG